MPTKEFVSQLLTCSVVVCTRDRLAQLDQCLAGISQQVFKPIEVIVVDNARGQTSAREIALHWGAKYFHESSLGASFARNRGAQEANGAIVAYIDDDGWPHPNWLLTLVAAFQDQTVMAASGRTVAPEADPEVTHLCRLIQGSGLAQDAFVLDNNHPQWFEIAAFGGVCASGTNMAFRRSAFDLWPGFDLRLGPPYTGCEDNYAFFSIVDSGFRAAYVPDSVVTHPTAYTVEGLRKRYLTGAAHSIAYVIFLFVNAHKQRRKLIGFVLGGLRGVRRDWRPPSETRTSGSGIPRWRIYLARLTGGWLYLRSTFIHHFQEVGHRSQKFH